MSDPAQDPSDSRRRVEARLDQSRLEEHLRRRVISIVMASICLTIGFSIVALSTWKYSFVPGVMIGFIGVGFLSSVTDAACPRCKEKFFGNPLRTFTSSACKNCGLSRDGGT